MACNYGAFCTIKLAHRSAQTMAQYKVTEAATEVEISYTLDAGEN